jgi:predicted transcriptional regulator YheO
VVVDHDLLDPEHGIAYIAKNLSGREVGDAATELGLAPMTNPNFPDVIANYSNTLPVGRPAKSTSIGLRDRQGKYI